MNKTAISEWNLTAEVQPPEGRYVLLWDSGRGLAMIAKAVKGRWFSTANNIPWKNGTHWAELIGPSGTHSSKPLAYTNFTRKDSQGS